MLCSSDPNTSLFIREEEKQYIKREMWNQDNTQTQTTTSWKELFESEAIFALIFTAVGIQVTKFVQEARFRPNLSTRIIVLKMSMQCHKLALKSNKKSLIIKNQQCYGF